MGVFGAGVIPYYTGRYAIDFLGKVDPYIARLPPHLGQVGDPKGVYTPGHNKYDLEYSIKKLRPTFVEGFEWSGQSLQSWGESKYANVNYEGQSVYLLRGSPNVHWEDIRASRKP